MALFERKISRRQIFIAAVLTAILAAGEGVLSAAAGEKPQNLLMLLRLFLIMPPALLFSLWWFARARQEDAAFNERQNFLDLRRLGLAAWLLVYGIQWIMARQAVKIDSLASLPMLYLGCFWGLGVSRFMAGNDFKNRGRGR